jgi:hypothetical protein
MDYSEGTMTQHRLNRQRGQGMTEYIIIFESRMNKGFSKIGV